MNTAQMNNPDVGNLLYKDLPRLSRKNFLIGVGAVMATGWSRLLAEPFGAGFEVSSPRIRRLLAQTLDHTILPSAKKVDYDPADEALPEPVRIGKRLKEYLVSQPIVIHPDEEFVGWLQFDGSVESVLFPRSGHRNFGAACRQYYNKPQDNLVIFEWQHTCGDYHKILNRGLSGIRQDIEASKARWTGNRERLDYLRGMELTMDGIEERVRLSAAECRRLAASETEAGRRTALLAMAARLDRVPVNPAQSFEEAVQSLVFCFSFFSDSLGRLDQYLAPYYFADIKSGRITRERACECLQELFIFVDAQTVHESNNHDKGGESHMTIGGVTRDGKDGWTDFSKLVVESVMACDLKRPQMTFRWHPGTRRETLRFVMDCERKDPNKRIAFGGDVRRIPLQVERLGFTVEDARDYCLVGCNEMTAMGGVCFGGLAANAVRVIDRLFGECRAETVACGSWDAFAALFEREFVRDLGEIDDWSKKFNALRARDCNVLSALFFKGCVENAESPTRGGATYIIPTTDMMGMPNLIDSLCVIRQFVFEQGKCTMSELADALRADWKGHEELLATIRREGKFYGGNDPFSNGMARFVHTIMARFARDRRDYFGRRFGYGSLTGYKDNFAKFGSLTGATPDGRHAGEALSFGSGPADGRATDVTSVLLSVAQMDPDGAMCNSPILNIGLPGTYLTDEGDFEKMVAMVETYFRVGGIHLQVNCVSRETLVDAQRHPEKYPSLRVRVSGFSGYFVRLPKVIQDEIISRTVASVR